MRKATKVFLESAAATAGIELAFRFLNGALYPTRIYTGSPQEFAYFEGQRLLFEGAIGITGNKFFNRFVNESKLSTLKKLGYRIASTATSGIGLEVLRSAVTYSLVASKQFSTDYVSKFLIEPRNLLGEAFPEILRAIGVGVSALYFYDIYRKSR